jgi:hypothetical protein
MPKGTDKMDTVNYTATFESGDEVTFSVTGRESIVRRLYELEGCNDFGYVVGVKKHEKN